MQLSFEDENYNKDFSYSNISKIINIKPENFCNINSPNNDISQNSNSSHSSHSSHSSYSSRDNTTILNNNKKLSDIKIAKFNNKISILKNINIQKSITWCNKYYLPINKQFTMQKF